MHSPLNVKFVIARQAKQQTYQYKNTKGKLYRPTLQYRLTKHIHENKWEQHDKYL
jgi:hypothetical protein